MRVVVWMLLGMLLVGCATRGVSVRCDGRLEPINAPAPVSERQAASTEDGA